VTNIVFLAFGGEERDGESLLFGERRPLSSNSGKI
jgi:hypothetical protein